MQPQSQQPSFDVWQYKPWWCQPWSILLTGLGLIGASWLLTHRIWVTVLVAIPVMTWMIFFLGVYPRLMAAGEGLQTDGEASASGSSELRNTGLEQETRD